MTLGTSIYFILTLFMVTTAIYRLVYHKYDFQLKNILNKVRKSMTSNEDDKEMFKVLKAAMANDFYGGSILTIFFIFFVEVFWFVMGLILLGWKFYLPLFLYNVILNNVEDKKLIGFWWALLIKVVYLAVYAGFGIAYYLMEIR